MSYLAIRHKELNTGTGNHIMEPKKCLKNHGKSCFVGPSGSGVEAGLKGLK